MDAGGYLIGCTLLALVVGPLAYGSWRARSGVLSGWTGGRARLAEIVIALATIVIVAEVLGAFGWFARAPLVLASVAAGAGLAALGRVRAPADGTEAPPAALPSPRAELAGAVVAVTAVGAQWIAKVAFAFDKGMTHPDTVWYHAPYAAEFVQRGNLLRELDRTDPLHAFAGHTSELLHAVLTLCLGRDALLPLVNVGWAALALLAAWCVGSRRGAGALCVVGGALVLGLPTVAATHPGQASNDVMAAALLVSAIALLVNGRLAVAPITLAGLAAGLALGTKITAVAPVAVLTAGVVWLAWRRARPFVAVWWSAAVALTGSFWFLRNISAVRNPVPYYTLRLGPFTLSGVPQRHPDAVARYLFDGDVWREVFRPGLGVALGRAWPVVILLGLGAALAFARGNEAVDRLAAAAVLAGLVAYLFTPYTADFFAFRFNVRYATPSLLGAAVVFSAALATRRSVWRLGGLVVMLGVIAVDLTARHHERVAAWPASGRVLWILAVGVAAAVGGACVWAAAHGRTVRYGAIAAVVVGVVLLLGWPLQRHADTGWYVEAGLPLDAADAALRRVADARIAFFGTSESYPFYGRDLSNRVTRPLGPPPDAPPDECRRWVTVLRGYDYAVVARQPFAFDGPPESVLDGDAGARRVAGDEQGSVYRLAGSLSGSGC